MACLVLALVAPAQSWGTTSRFDDRDTGTEPTKSGVIGLLAAALGRERHEPIDDLTALRLGVRVDREGILRSDYHTALGALRSSGKQNDTAVVSNRAYLSDAAFVAVLEHDDPHFLHHLHDALNRPRWPLYLGRRAFPPAGPVTRGVVLDSLDAAIANTTWLEPSRYRQRHMRQRLTNDERIELRTVIEATPGDATLYVTDQPLRFEPREFAHRPVRQGSVRLTLDMLPPES